MKVKTMEQSINDNELDAVLNIVVQVGMLGRRTGYCVAC